MTALASPCVGLCRIAAPSGLCSGCARDRDEIAGWGNMQETARARVWAALPDRRAALGIHLHRLPWGAAGIRDFVRASLRPGAGAWVFGAPGALAEFSLSPGEAAALREDGDALTVRTARGAVRFSGFGRLRALASGRGPAAAVALAVRREDIDAVAISAGLADLGPDRAALDPLGGADRLYDLGLGASPSRFCVRVADPGLRARLEAARGTPWRTSLPRLGPALRAASPPRVVLTPAGRAEVYGPIPPADGASPPGPRTHLRPAALEGGHEAPPALGIPAGYAVGAIRYPDAIPDGDRHAH